MQTVLVMVMNVLKNVIITHIGIPQTGLILLFLLIMNLCANIIKKKASMLKKKVCVCIYSSL